MVAKKSSIVTPFLNLFGAAACFCFAVAPIKSPADDRSVNIIQGVPEQLPSTSQPVHPNVTLNTKNPAGVTVEVLPSQDLTVGTKIAFRVATRKPGYLLLVDIDAAGKLTQIYPNVLSLAMTTGKSASRNLIKPGESVTIPDANNPLARFEFLAEPPLGMGTVVAILSDRSVQMVDLPDLPETIASQQDAVDYLYKVAQGLKIAPAGKLGRLLDCVWSFAAKSYQIK